MIRNEAGQVVTANLIYRTTGLPVSSGVVTVDVLGAGSTKVAGVGTIENEGVGTWSYFPTKEETDYPQVTFSFNHDDAIRVDVQFNPVTSQASTSVVSERAALVIAEAISGLRFGASVRAISNNDLSTTYRLIYAGTDFEVGSLVRLVGGGVSAEPFEVTDAGLSGSDYWIEVESDEAIAPVKILPILEYEGEAQSLHVYCHPRPVFSAVSVKSRYSAETMWSDSDSVTTLDSTQYESFRSGGIKAGVRLQRSAVPTVPEGGEFLIKRMRRQQLDGVKVTYAAGFYPHLPADLESAISQIVAAIESASASGGVFASESLDYYSYSALSYDQLAAMPHAALSILRRYSRV